MSRRILSLLRFSQLCKEASLGILEIANQSTKKRINSKIRKKDGRFKRPSDVAGAVIRRRRRHSTGGAAEVGRDGDDGGDANGRDRHGDTDGADGMEEGEGEEEKGGARGKGGRDED